MARPGNVWVPNAFTLPDGTVLRREATESVPAFEKRTRAAATAMQPAGKGLPLVFAIEGEERLA
jgi:hypothetical protein